MNMSDSHDSTNTNPGDAKGGQLTAANYRKSALAMLLVGIVILALWWGISQLIHINFVFLLLVGLGSLGISGVMAYTASKTSEGGDAAGGSQ